MTEFDLDEYMPRKFPLTSIQEFFEATMRGALKETQAEMWLQLAEEGASETELSNNSYRELIEISKAREGPVTYEVINLAIDRIRGQQREFDRLLPAIQLYKRTAKTLEKDLSYAGIITRKAFELDYRTLTRRKKVFKETLRELEAIRLERFSDKVVLETDPNKLLDTCLYSLSDSTITLRALTQKNQNYRMSIKGSLSRTDELIKRINSRYREVLGDV